MFNRCYVKTKSIKHLRGRYNLAALGKTQLKRLRDDVVLCSLYINDYKNRYNIDPAIICDFFDGYAEYLSELMQAEIENYNDLDYFKHLTNYDNINTLLEYYSSIEF